jgi:hypothetical protein
MKKLRSHFLCFLSTMSFSTAAFSADTGMLAQKAWLSQFEEFFTTGLCEKKEYVRLCLKSSVSECKMTVKEQLNSCTSSVHLPEQIGIGRESELWGEKMGGCLAPKLITQTDAKKVNAKCTNLSAW